MALPLHGHEGSLASGEMRSLERLLIAKKRDFRWQATSDIRIKSLLLRHLTWPTSDDAKFQTPQCAGADLNGIAGLHVAVSFHSGKRLSDPL